MDELDNQQTALKIIIKGIVQGVGFRPFIYRLAHKYQIKGYISNTSNGVVLEVESPKYLMDSFIKAISQEAPPLSRIEDISIEESKPKKYSTFTIKESIVNQGFQLISPDISICKDCHRELFDPHDRRFKYPFINCTNCGPRFTIIKDIPYDREKTTMAVFPMCPDCEQEYHDPLHRRFHAQPNACAVCGPHLFLTNNEGTQIDEDNPITKIVDYLKAGNIVAIKGLGGFHLACDAFNSQAVETLRKRKNRPYKPFALMMKDLDEVKKYCSLSEFEAQLLISPQAPIVLLKKNINDELALNIAPNINYLGVMLPYTPLHHLILNEFGGPLIMTSGNLSEEPISYSNQEALVRLKGLADYFLMHNRDIYACYDDSVITQINDSIYPIRKARGYSPVTLKLNIKNKNQILACGADLKNTFTFINDGYAFISQHNGDLEDYQTYMNYQRNIEIFQNIFKTNPDFICHDLHPDYYSTRYAKNITDKGLKGLAVQHHHAHIASCMAENMLDEKVIGIAFDGVGWGSDHKLWGGEFLIADYKSFIRFAHLEYLPLPGGDISARKPYRTTISYLYSLFNDLSDNYTFLNEVCKTEVKLIIKQLQTNLNLHYTSSCGRLFDVVSSILNLCHHNSYEGQAAIELEMIAENHKNLNNVQVYPYNLREIDNTFVIGLKSLLSAIILDFKNGVRRELISDSFHNTLAGMNLHISKLIRDKYGINKVALSGGCFQNRLLVKKTMSLLVKNNFEVFIHKQLPPNDGGVSFGQAVIGYVHSGPS